MSDTYAGIRETCQKPAIELPRPAGNEVHFVIEDGNDLIHWCEWSRKQNYYLCTMVATDERFLEDHAFKLYYVFSAPDEKLVILEHPLNDPQYPTGYISIRNIFPSVEGLEREAHDLFGLLPRNNGVEHGFVLHAPYPLDLYPLRPGRSLESLIGRIKDYVPQPASPLPPLPEGMLVVPVGPIHAGVIEAGQFRFHVAGEVVEDLTIQLGYKHKGIEKLFETHYTLESGWELAEKVSGDSSFAHSMAYCQAVEALAGVEPTMPALCWRGLFLELERLYNHIGDMAAIVHDMAFDLAASEIAVLREQAVRLNHRLTTSRLLRGINRPGGVALKNPPNLGEVQTTIADIAGRFLGLSKLVLDMPACRDRAITTGILTRKEAKECGATGVAARASGLWKHDFRLKHPQGVYARRPELRDVVRKTIIASNEIQPSESGRRVPIYQEDLQGDVFARMALRAAEVETSADIIERLANELKGFGTSELLLTRPLDEALRATHNFEFGLGYVEGWRGDIVYWVMKGPDNTIFRCKVRDPSVFNWPALRQAVIRKSKTEGKGHWENILADFPLINKSFNLSYSGHDL